MGGCSQDNQNVMEFDDDLLESKLDDFRDSIERFDYEEADRLHAEISEILEENKQIEDRNFLENYLNSLYQAKEDGLTAYQEFLKGLPKDYDGVHSDVLWRDYKAIFEND